MNFFKKIGSFTTNTWKDFSDFNEQQPLETVDTNNSTNSENDKSKEVNFEIKKRNERDVMTKKGFNGFFRSRFSKKKLLVDDPRSPTIDFQRTPIFFNNNNEANEAAILSPFNVNEMLATVNSALNITPIKKVSVEFFDYKEPETNFFANLQGETTVDVAFNWNNFKYDDKVLSESLIVEMSTLDINVESIEKKVLPEDESIKTEENAENEVECKVVGFVAKSEEQNNTISSKFSEKMPENEQQQSVNTALVVTSTPKKSLSCKKPNLPRTPLQSINKNSPMIGKNSQTQNVLGKFKKTKQSRQLPKAPSTPMTPLHRGNKKCIADFDKENF